MELAKISFKRKTFDIIPENERIFIVQLSLFANEITMLHKLKLTALAALCFPHFKWRRQ
jgi:hypothetical protein